MSQSFPDFPFNFLRVYCVYINIYDSRGFRVHIPRQRPTGTAHVFRNNPQSPKNMNNPEFSNETFCLLVSGMKRR